MNRRILVLLILVVAVAGFTAATYFYLAPVDESGEQASPTLPVSGAAPEATNLVRFHSPSFGPASAPVTVVEFFDPSCEACRAFYPIVKQMMEKHPDDIRLVLRYVLNHPGSEEAARIIETARKQGVFLPVVEALLASQPEWHDDPRILQAWEAAERAGLDVQQAREQMMAADITAILEKDMADARQFGVRATPTFFVNGRELTNFGVQPLYSMILSEIERAR